MRCLILLTTLFLASVNCDINYGEAAGQIFQNILPGLISNQATGQQGSATNTLQQIGTVVGGVIDYGKKKSYEEMLQSVATSTSDEDLKRVSEEMFAQDFNNANSYIKADFQGKTTAASNKDEAPNNLLTVPENVWTGPTIRPLVALFDNYHKNVIRPEFPLPNEEEETKIFINTVLGTGPIRALITFLNSKGLTQLNELTEQTNLLNKIWFTKYARHWTNLCKCSCPFETVFMAELKSNEVIGLHSWLFFARRELDKKANYLGYIDKLDLAGRGSILKYHAILSDTKETAENTMFVGTSPELELALHTLCFMARPDRPCNLQVNGIPFTINVKTRKVDSVTLIDDSKPSFVSRQ